MKGNLEHQRINRTQKRTKRHAATVRASIIDALRNDLVLALEFLKIARTSSNQETAARNRRHARKAYDTVLHFMAKMKLNADEFAQIRENLQQVELELGKRPPAAEAGIVSN